MLTPSWAQRAFHDLDFFFETRDEFQQCHSLGPTVLLRAIEASIPEKPESIGLSTLIDFREKTKLQRLKFRQEVDALIDGLFNCSTEDDLQKRVKLCGEYIAEQVNILELKLSCAQDRYDKKDDGNYIYRASTARSIIFCLTCSFLYACRNCFRYCFVYCGSLDRC